MANRTRMPPAFVFRMDEISEREDAPHNIDNQGRWMPLAVNGVNERKSRGISYQWWYFNGVGLQVLPNQSLPPNTSHFKTFSVFYSGGAGFYVLHGDATRPANDVVWHSLMFDHNKDLSSTVCQTGSHPAMRCHNPDALWPKMLLPDIYHGPQYPYAGYGGLIGELPIFLALIGFSMNPDRLFEKLPEMFQNGRWMPHSERPGHTHKRGVVVSVYAYSNNHNELENYEDGLYGKFYSD